MEVILIMKKLILVLIFGLIGANCYAGNWWNTLTGATRVGAATILFGNYAIMHKLVIPAGKAVDKNNAQPINPSVYRVYNFYKDASLVCGIGLLLPRTFPVSITNFIKKYW